MFRVSTVLRRVPSAVPQTVVGQRFWLRPFKNGQGLPTCSRFGKVHSLQPTECTFQPGACIHGPFSNAGRQCTGALSKSTICNENVPMTRATSPPWTLFGIMTRVEPCVDQRPSASLRASIDDAVCADVFPPAHQCGRWRGHWHNKIP